MTNTEAADVLREYIRTNKPCNGLETALQKAITALEHQPEPQTQEPSAFGELVAKITGGVGGGPAGYPDSQQCVSCGHEGLAASLLICPACGSTDLRPVYVSNIGRMTP